MKRVGAVGDLETVMSIPITRLDGKLDAELLLDDLRNGVLSIPFHDGVIESHFDIQKDRIAKHRG